MWLGRIVIGGVLAMAVLMMPNACEKQEKHDIPYVHPYDGDDMAYVPLDQGVLYGVWKNEDGSAVIEVSGDQPHMVVTENGNLIFEGDVRLVKYGFLYFTDGKDGDGNESNAPYLELTFSIKENVYRYRKLFDGTVVTFTKQAEVE